jgi:hypothetical protein
MLPNVPPHLPHSPLYLKALDILTLSRNISHYLVEDLSPLSDHGSEDQNLYFSGDIVQQSGSLAPEIIRAESEPFSEGKHKHAASVQRLTRLLYRNCDRLERASSNGKDFIPLLRKELRKFSKLQRSWMLTL